MRVVICGAGLAGLSTALFLQRAGHEPILIEHAPALRGEGYMLDFFSSGYDVCERAGLLPALERIHHPIDRFVFVDGAGVEQYAWQYARIRRLLFQDRHFNFSRGDLERVLFDAVRSQVEIRFGATVARFADRGDAVEVQLGDGRSLACDVLVGADGVHSRIRRLLLGDDAPAYRRLGFHTAAFILPSQPAALGDCRSFYSLSVPGRSVSVYPMRGGKLATFFLHYADEEAPREHAAKVAELRRAYAGIGWVVPEILAACAEVPDLYLDDVTQIELPTWSAGRVALVGDACQCVSLLAGQGASLAIAGGYLLARELARSPGDVPGALARYAAWLQDPVRRKQRAGRKAAGWFLPQGRTKLAVRNLVSRMAMTSVGAWLVRRQLAGASVLPAEAAPPAGAASQEPSRAAH